MPLGRHFPDAYHHELWHNTSLTLITMNYGTMLKSVGGGSGTASIEVQVIEPTTVRCAFSGRIYTLEECY
jgi:hypothetical protein